MKVLQILSGPLQSGAGRGALSLHLALRERGVDSRILGKIERGVDPSLFATRISGISRLWGGIQARFFTRRLERHLTNRAAGFYPVRYGLKPQQHPLYSWADVIHIQWAHASTLGPEFLETLHRERRPVLVTLRDMWAFTGGCHFAMECEGYKYGCRNCPVLMSGAGFIAINDVLFKKKVYNERMTFVAISEDIAKRARSSELLGDLHVEVIPNSIDVTNFEALDKSICKASLGVPQGKFIVAIGAVDLSDERKGAKIIAEVVDRCGLTSDIHFVVFGGNFSIVQENISYFGPIADRTKINQIYSAADVFVMPSLQESFGKTTAEALASGTPVLAFSRTPAVEIIDDSETGWIVPHGDGEALYRRIEMTRMMEPQRLQDMGLLGRQRTIQKYSARFIAAAHEKLYSRLLAGVQDAS